MRSRYFSSKQLLGLAKVGLFWIPGRDPYPSFRELGCIEHIDRVAETMPDQDRMDLAMLLGILGSLPQWGVNGVLKLLIALKGAPSPIGDVPRLVLLGLKGVVMSLYYSGLKGNHYSLKGPLELLGYELKVAKK